MILNISVKLNMDQKRMGFIRELRNNARKKLTEISRKLNIPVSTLADGLRSLESKGLISYKAMLNFEKIGYPLRKFFLVRTENSNRDNLRSCLRKIDNINNLHAITNGYDFLFEAVFKNQKEVQVFFDRIETEDLVRDMQFFNVV